jgi:hypothetical protein
VVDIHRPSEEEDILDMEGTYEAGTGTSAADTPPCVAASRTEEDLPRTLVVDIQEVHSHPPEGGNHTPEEAVDSTHEVEDIPCAHPDEDRMDLLPVAPPVVLLLNHLDDPKVIRRL